MIYRVIYCVVVSIALRILINNNLVYILSAITAGAVGGIIVGLVNGRRSRSR